jgi:hypothetical protein
MTITIREQVLAALRNNPGLNNAKLAELIDGHQKDIRDGEHAAGRRPASAAKANTASAFTA